MKNGWLNLYKPLGISSAGLVAKVKRALGKNVKVGHTGTLDLEAEGVLPIAVGEATKLVQFLMDARKTYRFTVKFGATTDTGDRVGKVTATCEKIPSHKECMDVCEKFVGVITQVPPKYSALKISGVPAYKLAREGKAPEMKPRQIEVYSLQCTGYTNGTATYVTDVSKGTYIRTLAEDISLCLQSLGFVLELARTKVGIFTEETSVRFTSDVVIPAKAGIQSLNYLRTGSRVKSGMTAIKDPEFADISALLQDSEVVLADIPVIHVDVDIAQKVRYGQKVFVKSQDIDLVWLEHESHVLAIGKVSDGCFVSARVLNL